MLHRRLHAAAALAVAASLPLSACSTTHLGGVYMPLAHDVTKSEDRQTLAKGSEWLWFWGLLDSGTFEFNEELKNGLRPEEGVADMVVKDRLSIGGFFLWIITAGLVSHHTLVASGRVATMERPPTSTPAPSTPPAGH